MHSPRRLRLRAFASIAALTLLAPHVPDAAASWPLTATLAKRAPAAPFVATNSNARTRRPNIVLISTDDQAMTDLRWMPKTRRLLAGAGITFPNMISPHPLCCPARAEILTGQYAQNNGVRSNAGKYGGWHRLDSSHTIATWLHRAGYRTAFVGKYLNGYPARPSRREPGWDVWNPTLTGVYGYYGFTNFENGHPRHYDRIHNADYVGEKTVDYIERLHGSRKPFFIWASHVAPHGACNPRRELSCWKLPIPAHRHARLFEHGSSPSLDDPAFNEADVSDKPADIRDRPRTTTRQVNLWFRARIRSLQAVDDAVAKSIAALRRTGELANTVVAFTTDNGYVLGQHRYLGKNVPYEPAMSVPLLVRGPGIPAGVVRDQTVSTIDLAPTFLAEAHAHATVPVDGRRLVPMFKDPAAPGIDTALIQAGPNDDQQATYGWYFRGVRTARYTYVRYFTDGFVELYDRKRDPAELTNLAGDPAYADVLTELARRALLLESCAGADCRTRFGPVPEPLDLPLPDVDTGERPAGRAPGREARQLHLVN